MDTNLAAEAIVWNSADSHLLLNPRMPWSRRLSIEEALAEIPALPGHIWLCSSGTTSTGDAKLIALSKKAMQVSAHAVNQYLQVTTQDIWLNVLPTFHVGGLAIFVRANLAGNTVASGAGERWSPQHFVQLIEQNHATLTSLVPAQMVDIVNEELACPPSLRAVVVGGGALDPQIYRQARSLKWPVLPSFGMTECCSQIATASLESLHKNEFPRLTLLPHVQARSQDGRLEIKSAALFSATVVLQDEQVQFQDMRHQEWFMTNDRVALEGKNLNPLGRVDDIVKLLGELVNVHELELKIQAKARALNAKGEFCLVAAPSVRRGHDLLAVTTAPDLVAAERVIESYNSSVLPFERIYALYQVAELPKTELNKIRHLKVLDQIVVAHGIGT